MRRVALRTSPRIALRSCMLRRSRLMRRSRPLWRSAGRAIRVVRGRPRHLGVARRRRALWTAVRRRALRRAVHRRVVVRAVCIVSRKAIVGRRRPRHIVRGISLIRAGRCTGSVGDVPIALRRSSTVPSRHRGLIAVEAGRRSRMGHDAAVRRRSRGNTMGQRRVSAKNGLSGRSHIGRADKLSLTEC